MEIWKVELLSLLKKMVRNISILKLLTVYVGTRKIGIAGCRFLEDFVFK